MPPSSRPRHLVRLLVVLLLCLEAGCLAAPARADAGPDRLLPRGVWPLTPRPGVVRRFDPPESTYGVGHRGVDLLGRPGQHVGAALAGVVSFAGSVAGRGVVSVRHGGLRTTYEPVTATVEVGDSVRAGQTVGVLQPGPSHCRPAHCLHWGLLRGETYLDPLLLVGGGPVRLLPLTGSVGGAGPGPVRVVDRSPVRRSSLRSAGPRVSATSPGAASAAVAAARVGSASTKL